MSSYPIPCYADMQRSAAMFSMMFHRLTRTNFVYYNLVIRFNLSLSVNQTSHFSNFADFRQLQIPNARMKYYEILPTHTETPHNTNHKIANRYFEFKYHFATLQKNPITFEQGCIDRSIVSDCSSDSYYISELIDNLKKPLKLC